MSSSVESFVKLLQASRVFFRHHKSSSGVGKRKQLLVGRRKKSLLVSERVDKAATKKMTSRKSWDRGKFERCVQGELYQVVRRGKKKKAKRATHQIAASEEKVEKSCWKRAERFRKYRRWPNNLKRNPLLYGSLRGGAIPHRGPANYSDYVILRLSRTKKPIDFWPNACVCKVCFVRFIQSFIIKPPSPSPYCNTTYTWHGCGTEVWSCNSAVRLGWRCCGILCSF